MLKIRQDQQYVSDDWWKWSIWVDGPQPDLDEIEKVVYLLHSTFPNPVRTVTDRDSNFRLEAAGWGTFTIRAKVHFKGGRTESLAHELELHSPGGAPAPP